MNTLLAIATDPPMKGHLYIEGGWIFEYKPTLIMRRDRWILKSPGGVSHGSYFDFEEVLREASSFRESLDKINSMANIIRNDARVRKTRLARLNLRRRGRNIGPTLPRLRSSTHTFGLRSIR